MTRDEAKKFFNSLREAVYQHEDANYVIHAALDNADCTIEEDTSIEFDSAEYWNLALNSIGDTLSGGDYPEAQELFFKAGYTY
jgi:hypothetical protein|tara:strand:+ start:25917 stop:26165 length:249 start_codon:yes stop_codon:yes gene_type:complete